MKEALFMIVTYCNNKALHKVKSVAELMIAMITGATSSLLKLIDKDRMLHAESIVQQIEEITELQILSNIDEIKNDAIETGYWNEEHEVGLNFLGNLLCNQHDWEVEQVERYLHEVIATGPPEDQN